MITRGSLFVVVLLAASAHAQAPAGDAAGDALTPIKADDTTCLALDTTPGALLAPAHPTGALAPPIPWTEFVVDGELIDSATTAHALLEPTMLQYRTSLSEAKWGEIAKLTAKVGYQLVGHAIEGTKLELHLAPLPMISKVDVAIDQSLFDKLLDEEVRRRMRLRIGSYMPWEPIRRQCALIEERRRIEEYLFDEGYADASVSITTSVDEAQIKLRVNVDLGKEYALGRIEIPKQVSGEPLAFTNAEIRAQFVHTQTCVIRPICFGSNRFNRTHLQEDIQKVKDMFHKRGFPGVRVQSNFDPRTSFDRHTRTVNLVITIDQRRQLDVQFEGFDGGAVSTDDLRAQLTFDQAGSADDVEAAQSARAITTFLQQRGFFDARTTWQRERFETRGTALDSVVFRIDMGGIREVTSVEFVGNAAQGFDRKALLEVIATKETSLSLQGALFGGPSSASSVQLAVDVDRITEAYRRAGYRDARVRVTASPEPSGLDSAALTAPLVEGERGSEVHVRFTIEEGEPTLLSEIEIEQEGDGNQLDSALCDQVLRELAAELGELQLAIRTDPTRCAARPVALKFREDDVQATRDRLRDWMFKIGRPRALVDYAATQAGARAIAAHYKLSRIELTRIGKVVIRGNFKTHSSVIYRELGLNEGDKLTSDALADGARRLRNTGLFDAVNIDLPEIENRENTSPIVNAIVRIEERYMERAQIELETGYSSLNGLFGTARWTQHNLFGLGMAWTVSFTYGTKITDLESTFTIPPWILRPYSPFEFKTDLMGIYRQQDDPRFGQLKTEGVSVTVFPTLRSLQRVRTNTHPARAINLGLHLWDFRLRSRNVDALRPIGADQDQSQVAISTRSGSFGITAEWEQRIDRHGSLAPLAPEDGFHLQASVAYYSPLLLGQDTFIKVSLGGSRFIPIGNNLVIRGDVRYDEGFPLKGEALLPEVERFFAGGDSTVRGYNDDRMATQVIQVPLPPLSNVTQIRIIPAGGNIRMLASVDAQLRIYSILAGALFSDAGVISNQWSTVNASSIRPSVGTGVRILSPFGIGAIEYAVPLRLQLGDDPRGRWHVYFAARAQF